MRQLRAGTPAVPVKVKEAVRVKVKEAQADRPSHGRSSRWVQKLEAEKKVMQRRQKEADYQRQSHSPEFWTLRKEPKIWSRKLAGCLQHGRKGAPESSEEQLARVLQAAMAKLSSRESGTPSRTKAKAVETQTLVLQQKFQTFFECCVCTGQVPLAHHVLVTHHSNRDKQRVLTLDMYNTVMLGWAREVRTARALPSAGYIL